MQDASSLPPSLPQDLAACHALIAEQGAALVDLQASRETLSQENAELNLTIQKLLAQLRGHRSERHADPAQQQLDFGQDEAVQDGLADAAAELAAEAEEIIVRRRAKKPNAAARNCRLTWSAMKSSRKSRRSTSSVPSMVRGN
jgi:hypothetical protein